MELNFAGIGQRILCKLNELNMKQTDLCNETGLSTTAVSNYCTEKRIPDTASLHKIAKALKTSMEWLLTGENSTIEDFPESYKQSFTPTDQEAMLLGMIRLLPQAQQDEVFELVRFKYRYYVERKRESVFLSQDVNSSVIA